MASELHPWIFDLENFPSRLACGHPYRHVFEPKLNAQQCAICEAFFFSKCFEQSTSWSFGSHFFVARSHRFIATCPCRFLALFFKGKACNENSFDNFSLQPTAALVRHALKFARLLSIQFCSSHYWAMRVSCLVLTSILAAADAAARSVMFVFKQINTSQLLQ